MVQSRKRTSRTENKIDNFELKAIAEADPFKLRLSLALSLNISKTILDHLRKLTKQRILRNVAHELSDSQREARVQACIRLLNRRRNALVWSGMLDLRSPPYFR